MWIKKSDRENLTEILLHNNSKAVIGGYASDSFNVDQIMGDEFYLIWALEPKNKRSLPNIIVVADGHLKDFLAWAVTYFPAYRPFTAFFRVLELKEMSRLKNWFEPPSLNELERACVGLIISETYSMFAAAEKPASLTVGNCFTNISYALSRALALGADENQMDIVGENWLLARKLTDQPIRKLEIKHVKDIFQMLIILRSGGQPTGTLFSNTGIPQVVVEACFQLKSEGTVSIKTWDELTSGVEELKAAQRQMEASREDRVRYFQRLFSNKSFSKLSGELVQAFVCGYLGSLIGPGSFSHIELVTRCVSQFPTVLLWYGLCAGFHRKSELLTSFNVLGRRLLRELIRFEPLLSPPSADIHVSELRFMLERSEKQVDFSTSIPYRVVAELLPCISTYLIWPKREIKQQRELFPNFEESFIKSEQLSELGSTLRQALDIYKKIVEPKNHNNNTKRKPEVTKKKKSRSRRK